VKVTLTVIAGPHQGVVFAFTEHDTFLVGRSRRAHFQLKDKDRYFSRIHFMVECNPPHCLLMDLQSHNGTFVNGQRVQVQTLKSGDEVKAGHTILRVAITADLDATDPLRPPPAALAATVSFQGQMPAAARPAALPDGSLFAGYRLLRKLGHGGMGVVYLAQRLADGSQVALKTIIPTVAAGPGQVERFLREAHILRELDHPYIVPLHDVGEADGRLFFAMEYVAGPDAAQLLRKDGPLPVRMAVRMIRQLLQALEYAHAKRFVHRDVKPANLLVAQEDGRKVVKLVDFGLARVYQASQLSGLTLQGSIGGTVAFMSPEQVMHFRDVQPASDQYSTAATLYNLLTGNHVHDGSDVSVELIAKILQEEPVPIRDRRPDLSGDLAAVIHRGLARQPEKRFANVREMRRALLPFAQ
jgi:serine/threonine-protein kinase